MYLAQIDGLFVENIFLYKVFFLEIDVTKPLVKNVVKHKNKNVTSDVDITVVLVVQVKIKKSSVKIFQKRWQVKNF